MALDPGAASLGVAWLEPTTGEFQTAEWDGPGRFEALRDEIGACRPARDPGPPRRGAAGLALRPGAAGGRHPPRTGRRPRLRRRPRPPRAARPLRRRDPRGLRLRGPAAGHGGRRRRPALRARDAEARPAHVTSLDDARRAGRPHDRHRDPPQPRARRELRRRQPPRARSSTCSTTRGRPWARACCGSGSCGPSWSSSACRTGSTPSRSSPSAPSTAGVCARRSPRSRTSTGSSAAWRWARPARAISSALGRSLRALPGAAEAVADCVAPLVRAPGRRSSIPRSTSPTTSLRTLVDEPPALVREGGFVRDGVDPELDELRSTSRGGRETIAAIEQRERERTGIQSLKVRFNRVFGYYIEVSKPNLPLVPADYVRKQTIAGGERFVTPELKDYEDRVLRADELILERETRALRGAARSGRRRGRGGSSRPRAPRPRSTCSPRSPRRRPATTTSSRGSSSRTSSSTSRAGTR